MNRHRGAPLSSLGRSLRDLWAESFFSFMTARIAASALALLTTIGLTRVLTRGDFGLWVYASGILQLFLLFSGLGTASAILRFCSLDRGYARLATLHRSLAIGVVASLALTAAIAGSSRLLPLRLDGTDELLLFLALTPLPVFLVAAAVAYFQAASRARDAAAVLLASGSLQAGATVVLGWLGGLPGVVLGQYLGPVGGLATLAWRADRWPRLEVSRRLVRFGAEARRLLRFGLTSMAANVASTILVAMDTLAIGLIVGSTEAVATYKVAAILPLGLLVLPVAVMQFFIPRFARHADDRRQLKHMLLRLLAASAPIHAALAGGILLAAPRIVRILGGPGYADVTDDVVAPMRILAVAYFFSATLRIPFGNVLFAVGRVGFNLVSSVATGLLNIVLDLWLVSLYGSVGAAIATAAVIVLSCVSNGLCVWWHLRHLEASPEG